MLLRIKDEGNRRVVMPSATTRWRLTPRTIDRGVTEGWLAIGRDEVTLYTPEDVADVKFKILSRPGQDEDGKPDATRRFFDLERLEG